MASTYNGQGIFNSGPHRFRIGVSGSQLLSNGRLNPVAPGNTAIGALEREVVVIGRLVATSESGLNTLLNAVAAQIASPPTRATLVDHHGRQYTEMDFVSFTPGDRVDRGAGGAGVGKISMAYEARFVRLTS